jgi:NAD(P)-dependent dehydrogenase (short-subunit alcohol dehydrogenase family)
MPTALITGVNRGLGLEFIKQYGQAGWTVIGTCRDLEAARDARAVAEAHAGVSLYSLDVADATAVEAFARQLAGTAIDVLILNAGVMGHRSLKLGELDAEDFLQVMNVNVVAPMICLQAFRGHVAASERRVVVGMGSFLGSIASNEDGGLYSYRCSKAGIHAAMHSASIDLREQGIIAIAMHPGWVKTDMGGDDALLDSAQSIAGMIRVIDGLGPADSGRLLTYSGEELPW